MAGIALVGNWVLDRSKFIDYYPEINGHTTIHKSIPCPGGGALNAQMALTRLQPDFPLYGIGIVAGERLRGRELVAICKKKNINMDFIQSVHGQASFTDAMILPDGSRTQFHCPGVNDLLSPDHIPLEQLKEKDVKLFYLGHIMILAGMDEADEEYGTKSARLLHQVQQAGMETVIDFVSNPSRDYQKLVAPAARYSDYIVCNEFEAEQLADCHIRRIQGRLSLDGLHRAAQKIIDIGIKKAVIIHSPEVAYALDSDGNQYYQSSLNIPAEYIIDSCGAGDAFCAGILYGIHQKWDMQQTLLLAVCTAAASLMEETNTDGVQQLTETLALAERWPPKESPHPVQ